MESLNNKINTTQEDTLFQAQAVGVYGYNPTDKKMKAGHMSDANELKVAVSQHLVDGPDMKARSDIADPTTSTFLKCDADGKLMIEATLELDSSGLSKEATQLLVKSAVEVGHGAGNNTRGNIGDGATNQNVVCLGYDQPNGKMVSLNVNASGDLSTTVASGHGLATEAKQDTQETSLNSILSAVEIGQVAGNNTRGNIGDGQTLPSAICLGYDNGNGKMVSIDVDADGHLQVDVLSGASTSDASAANQVLQLAQETIIAGDTTSIDGKITACNTSAIAGSVSITGTASVAGTVSVSNLPAVGQLAMAGSLPVVIASNQSSIPVSVSSLPLPSGGATAALQTTQETTLDAIQVLITAGNAILTTIDTDTGAMVVDLAAIEISNAAIKVATEASAVDLAALEVLQTAANVDLAALEVLQTTIAGDTTSIDGKITACNTGAVVVSSSALPSGAATSAKQDIAETTLNALEVLQTAANVDLAALEVLQTTIAGDTTSIDGKITACNTGAVVLAAGSAAIGKLAANSGVDIGDVDVLSLPAKVNSDTTLWSASTSITNGATLTSAVIDKNGAYRLSAAIVVDANGGSGYSIQAQGSANNTTYFNVGMAQQLTNPSLSTSIEFDTSFRYVKVKITNSVGSDRSIVYSVASHANGL